MREQYLDLVRKIREAIPDVVLSTDIIVGFPGETDEQFEETMSLVREVRFDSAYTFIYSPREGTPAAEMKDDISAEVKKERLQRLNELVAELSLESDRKLEGQVVEVLVEGPQNQSAHAERTYAHQQACSLPRFTGSGRQIRQCEGNDSANLVAEGRAPYG